MLSEIPGIQVEQTPDRLKIILPTKRNWPLLLLLSLLLVVWLVGMVWGIIFTIRDAALSGQRFAFIFTILLLIWLYLWYRVGKLLWKQWQFYAADREILFFEGERLIIRRPVSILGITDAYDMNHVSPFYMSKRHNCPAFDYGHRRFYFGQGLKKGETATELVQALNELYFPHTDDDEED